MQLARQKTQNTLSTDLGRHTNCLVPSVIRTWVFKLVSTWIWNMLLTAQPPLTVECNLYIDVFFSRPKAPAFVFLSPLEPKWSHLRSIIPNVLQLSVIGYPFVNPGPVGGVAGLTHPYTANETESLETQLKDELELYVRWWQLNTFLPMIHFVKPPTAFPDSLVSTPKANL